MASQIAECSRKIIVQLIRVSRPRAVRAEVATMPVTLLPPGSVSFAAAVPMRDSRLWRITAVDASWSLA